MCLPDVKWRGLRILPKRYWDLERTSNFFPPCHVWIFFSSLINFPALFSRLNDLWHIYTQDISCIICLRPFSIPLIWPSYSDLRCWSSVYILKKKILVKKHGCVWRISFYEMQNNATQVRQAERRLFPCGVGWPSLIVAQKRGTITLALIKSSRISKTLVVTAPNDGRSCATLIVPIQRSSLSFNMHVLI